MLVDKINKFTAAIQASLGKGTIENIELELDNFLRFIQGYRVLVRSIKFVFIGLSRGEHADKKESFEKHEIAYCERIDGALNRILESINLCFHKKSIKEISATFKDKVLPAIYENERIINSVSDHLKDSMMSSLEAARKIIKREYKLIQVLEEIEKKI